MQTIDEHVDRIIALQAPSLGCRVDRAAVDEILQALRARIKDKPELHELAELRPYDFKGTNHLWRHDGAKDYALARELSHRATETICREKRWDFIAFVQNITQKQLWGTTINRWGTTAHGLSGNVYTSHVEAILDLAHDDGRYAAWNDVQWYDFKKAHYTPERARELTHTLLQKLITGQGGDFVQLVRNMRSPPGALGIKGWQDAFKCLPINRYGTTLQGLIDKYDDSPAKAILDLVRNDERYRDYRDLAEFDFPDQRNIWNLKNGRKNYALARKAMERFLEKLELLDETLPEIRRRVSERTTQAVEINRYGTTIYGMVKRAYSGNLTAAINDWLTYGRASPFV